MYIYTYIFIYIYIYIYYINIYIICIDLYHKKRFCLAIWQQNKIIGKDLTSCNSVIENQYEINNSSLDIPLIFYKDLPLLIFLSM